MSNIEEMIKNSSCFGLAYSPKVRECKICEVALRCQKKCTLGSGEKPVKPKDVVDETPKVEDTQVEMGNVNDDKPKKKKPTKPKKNYDPSMPVFKDMGVDEMFDLLESRGAGNRKDFEKYTNPSILKMRLTMALKKTYEI